MRSNCDPPVFICSKCGAKHPSTDFDIGTGATPEETAKLREAWLKAYDRISAAEDKERAEASEFRASFAYFTASRVTNTWKFPETMTTVRGVGGVKIVCLSCTG